MYQAKRDRLLAGLAGTPWRFTPAEGGFFQVFDASDSSSGDDGHWARTWTRTHGLATIPLSAFLHAAHTAMCGSALPKKMPHWMRQRLACATLLPTMATELHIIGLQTDLQWRDPRANLAHFDGLLAPLESTPCDVVILPEMFTTGFSWPPVDAAPDAPQPLDWMQSWADNWMPPSWAAWPATMTKVTPATVAGLYPPEGAPTFYDKRHLFSLAGEHNHFTAGEDRSEVEFRGFRILLQVCYDLRFPVFSRNNREHPYDMAIYRRQLAGNTRCCVAHPPAGARD